MSEPRQCSYFVLAATTSSAAAFTHGALLPPFYYIPTHWTIYAVIAILEILLDFYFLFLCIHS